MSVAQDAALNTGAISAPALAELSSTNTERYIAVHGRRSLAGGYPQTGLEIWAYPLQILAEYQVGFRPAGSTTEVPGQKLLQRIVERPNSVIRIYSGPDYVIKETIFVPLDHPSAKLRYEVHSKQPMCIDIHFKPSLNLMWPAAIGGQAASWNEEAHGYVLDEPAHGLRGVIASPEASAHDATANSTIRTEGKLSFSIMPTKATTAPADAPYMANVYIGQFQSPEEEATAVVHAMVKNTEQWENEAVSSYKEQTQSLLRITTPDENVNAALAWSQIALDQAWVCNSQLGCGLIAGYGPSRNERRPQYAWFFAGDGLVATNALIAEGAFARAKDELLFIEKYQDKKTGMIWHELSQSAGYLDWSKYPYMYVHVDISYDYLSTIARYVSASGDTDFASAHWSSIYAAYQYCLSLVGPDGVPLIPTGKLGGDEQHRPVEDLRLSTSWISAARGYAALAAITGHKQLEADALRMAQRAQQSIAAHNWNAARKYWIDGHTALGAEIFTRRSAPTAAINENIFSPQQKEAVLNQLASSVFRTDWGMRGAATDSSIYDPWAYATGSVSAMHSADLASMFWMQDRPEIAWSIWQSLVPWNTLDSLGHLHEVVAGNYYRAQTESVPEQTWSSAAFLDAFVRGALGVEVQGAKNRILFRPHLLAGWEEIAVENIVLPHSKLSLKLRQEIDAMYLDVQNNGAPATIFFEPQIPFGAQLVSIDLDSRKVAASVKENNQDTHVSAELNVPSGASHVYIQFVGGVMLLFPNRAAAIGDTSSAIKLTHTSLQDRHLHIYADISAHADNHMQLRTPWKIESAVGATMEQLSEHTYSILWNRPAQNSGEYTSQEIEIVFSK